MCVISMVGDHYSDRWRPMVTPPYPSTAAPSNVFVGVSRAEFEALKAEVEEMKALLAAAKRIDELTGQPDCEQADKVKILRQVADLVGVSLDDVLGAS